MRAFEIGSLPERKADVRSGIGLDFELGCIVSLKAPYESGGRRGIVRIGGIEIYLESRVAFDMAKW